MSATNPRPSTEEHSHPQLDDSAFAAPALVCAYSEAVALPLPPLGKPVGRDWFSAHGVQDSQISGQHAVFSRPGGNLHVEDAGSRNGTWVNAVRMHAGQRVGAPDGTVLRLGNSIFVARDAMPLSPTPAPPLGAMVGPFGLRAVREALESIVRQRPRMVLIEGETGTGKELAAAVVAAWLGRATPFGAVNTAGVSAGVFEAQLFGYVRGAFSGSGSGSRGVFAAHNGGAVFLDEIGDMPIELQPKLLRVLDSGEVMPVGADRAHRVDVVVIAATNRPLEQMVESGSFRRDLFARLAAARIELPPLRERVEDLWAIASALLVRRGVVLPAGSVEVEAVERLMLHTWPGNARELGSVLERTVAAESAPGLRLRHVQKLLGPVAVAAQPLTRQVIDEAIDRCGGNETQAARVFGVSRGKLRRMLGRA